jgi:ABC-type transport system involved in multi-copper enzyme maturation permease subunit
MRAIRCIWRTAISEWGGAIRSRRALVLLLLYLASAVLCMNGTISVLGRMEKELASMLQLPDAGETGVVSASLWKSKPFNRAVRSVVGDSPVLQDISGRHPVELLYAWFVFFCAPILTVLVAGTRISEDIRSGAVRYMLVRETRLEWSLGKFIGQALMIAMALVVSALGATAVAFCRLPAGTAASLFLPMLNWGLRAWVYSLAWLGLALGLSHLTRSPSRATAFGIIAICLFGALPPLTEFLHTTAGWPAALTHVRMLVPAGAEMSLWRFSPVPLAAGSFHLITLGLTYLMAGAAFFCRRDV